MNTVTGLQGGDGDVVADTNAIDFTTLAAKSQSETLKQRLPYIYLENDGAEDSKEVIITVLNPTASSIELNARTIETTRDLLTLKH